MTINEAREKITGALAAAKEILTALELTVAERVFYTDGNLIESAELTEKTSLIFGELTVTCDGLEDGEECIFAICVEQRGGMVGDEDMAAAIEEFEGEIAEFSALVGASESKLSAMQTINEKQQAEAEEATAKLMAEIKRTKKKLFFAIGAMVAIIAAILIISAII